MGWLRVSCDSDCCTQPACVNPQVTALPVSCSSFTEYNITNYCETVDGCTVFNAITTAEFETEWGCPWCNDGTDFTCTAEMINDTGTFELSPSPIYDSCYQFMDEDSYQLPSCDENPSFIFPVRVGHTIAPPQPEVRLPDTIFTAFEVTYDADNAGSNVTTGLSSVFAGVFGASAPAFIKKFYVDYVYSSGVCKRYSFPIYGDDTTGYSVADHVTCINAQTTGSSADDLGLAATGTGTLLMSGLPSVPDYPSTNIGSGAAIPVKAYEAPEVYFTWGARIAIAPSIPPYECYPCDITGLNYGFTVESDTMQRLNTTQGWDDIALCPYNYSTWAVTQLGDRIKSLSVSMED